MNNHGLRNERPKSIPCQQATQQIKTYAQHTHQQIALLQDAVDAINNDCKPAWVDCVVKRLNDRIAQLQAGA